MVSLFIVVIKTILGLDPTNYSVSNLQLNKGHGKLTKHP